MKKMTSLGIRNFDLLYNCKNVDEVDKALNKFDIPKDPVKRKDFLHQFMGITQVFACGSSTPDEDYYVARQELIFINEQKNSESE
ncbi:MAG: hypothetical protein LBC73_10320 [Oscillospiraceae bacterium]|jgi:hypothetical protein|nr:hypothetical protein [Oscillospiraceae bacterium]